MITVSALRAPSRLALLGAATAALALAGFAASRVRTRAAEARNPAPGRIIDAGGVRLHVMQQGSGPDVLLIHGALMQASEMMLALGDALHGYRVTAIDRPGHGWSDRRRRPSVQDQAELFHEAAIELGLKSPVIVGHSLGGAVALAYGERYAHEISGVVAVAPLAFPAWGAAHIGRAIRGAPVLGPALSNTTLALGDPYTVRAVLPLVFNPQKPTAAFKDAIDRDMLSRPHAMVADGADFIGAARDLQKLKGRYADYPAALHIVGGDKDRILKSTRQAQRLARAVPNARLTLRPGLGHMVHHFAPEAVAAAVADVRSRSLADLAPPLAA
jgi:pimeloyl-ACP methyl ester carboxylesterase